MLLKWKMFNKWIKRNFPRDKGRSRLFCSVAEGLDKAESLEDLAHDAAQLDTLSAEFRPFSSNRRVARHTSDISHRLGKQGPTRHRNGPHEEEDFIKARLDEIREINERIKRNKELAEKRSNPNKESPRTGMLKFAKNHQFNSRSMMDLPSICEKTEKEDASSVTGSDSGLSMTSDTLPQESKSSRGESSSPQSSDWEGPLPSRPKTPYVDRKVSEINKKPPIRHRKRHVSMLDARGAGFYRQSRHSTDDMTRHQVDELAFLEHIKDCRTTPIRMHIVWNGIVV